jgi:hypothetical protein
MRKLAILYVLQVINKEITIMLRPSNMAALHSVPNAVIKEVLAPFADHKTLVSFAQTNRFFGRQFQESKIIQIEKASYLANLVVSGRYAAVEDLLQKILTISGTHVLLQKVPAVIDYNENRIFYNVSPFRLAFWLLSTMPQMMSKFLPENQVNDAMLQLAEPVEYSMMILNFCSEKEPRLPPDSSMEFNSSRVLDPFHHPYGFCVGMAKEQASLPIEVVGPMCDSGKYNSSTDFTQPLLSLNYTDIQRIYSADSEPYVRGNNSSILPLISKVDRSPILQEDCKTLAVLIRVRREQLAALKDRRLVPYELPEPPAKKMCGCIVS